MILFLDFDGTTHPIPCKDAQFFSCLPRLENVLRDYPEVQVVISSWWRTDHDLEQLRGYFSDDIKPRVIGATPLKEVTNTWGFIETVTRYEECVDWVRQTGYEGPWLALDDAHSEFPEGCYPFIRCMPETAFDEKVEATLRARLNGFLPVRNGQNTCDEKA